VGEYKKLAIVILFMLLLVLLLITTLVITKTFNERTYEARIKNCGKEVSKLEAKLKRIERLQEVINEDR